MAEVVFDYSSMRAGKARFGHMIQGAPLLAMKVFIALLVLGGAVALVGDI